MKKLILKLSVACALMMIIIVIMHINAVLSLQPEVDRVYTLMPDQDVLVLSSSELGCAIVESREYHNKMIWVSETSAASQLMRLKELERRNQLKHVKTLILPFNYTILMAQNGFTDKLAWYQELAVSWRYLDDLPCNYFEFADYILSNLRWPFHIHIIDGPPVRNPLSERPTKWRESFIRTQCVAPKGDFAECLPPGWQDRLLGVYSRIADICRRHHIRLVFVEAPLLPQYDAVQLPSAFQYREKWKSDLEKLGAEYCVVPGKFDESDFFDTRHLIKSSSIRFTDALYRKLGLEPFPNTRSSPPSPISSPPNSASL